MESLRQLKVILRSLVRRPGLSLAIVLTLALGIGASTAVYSVVKAILLKPLPYADPGELVMIWETDQAKKTNQEGASIPDYFSWKDAQSSFRGLGALQFWEGDLNDSISEPRHVVAIQATPDLLPLLGVEPEVGRSFLPAEGSPGGAKVAMLTDGFWRNRYGSDRSVIGKTIRLDGESFEVIGVLPSDFEAPVEWDEDLWTPLQASAGRGSRAVHNLRVIGRLRSEVSVVRAQEEMTALMSHLEAEFPDTNKARSARVVPLYESVVGEIRPTLWLLAAAVALVLLIVCSNVANLLIARTLENRREVAVRTALGSSKLGLLGRFLSEALILAVIGACLSVLLAWWILRLLLNLAPDGIPRLDTVQLDGGVLLFSFGLAILAAIACSVVPLVFASRLDIQRHLKEGGASIGQGRASVSGLLVVVAVAMAVVLTTDASLLVASFNRLRQVDLGFEPTGAAKITLTLPNTRYPFPGRETYPSWPVVETFYRQLETKVEAIPGVEEEGLAFHQPLDPGWETPASVEGLDTPEAGDTPEANFRPVSPGYFRAAGISVLRGRGFEPSDDTDHPRVAVVNSAFVARYGSADLIGKNLTMWGDSRRIVGEVENVRFNGPDQPPQPAVYTPLFQTPFALVSVIARTPGDPAQLLGPLRRAVWSIDPEIAIYGGESLSRTAVGVVGEPRFRMVLLVLFAVTALGVALIGAYSLVARSVAQRTNEIGLRMALGSDRRDIFVLVAIWGMKRLALGVGIGLISAFFFARLLSSFLFGIGAANPVVFGLIAVTLLVAGLLACLVPCRRASRLDPVRALRAE